GFRENRFGDRHESGEKPHEFRNEPPSQPLEPLPGESLAKYGSGPIDDPHEGSGEIIESIGAEVSGESRAGEEAPPTRAEGAGWARQATDAEVQGVPSVDEPQDPADSVGEGTLGGNAPEPAPGLAVRLSEDAAGAPRAPEASFEDTLAAARRIFEDGAEAENDAASEGFEEDESFGRSTAGFAGRETSEELSESSGFPEGPGEEAEISATDEKAPSQGSDDDATDRTGAEQSYTLHDYPQRPRVAPRRGRKGGRPFRGHRGPRPESGSAVPSRAGNHHPLPISELLKEGQEILVQIAKEPLGTKGARITSHIALPGRYLVYMPTITHIGVSRKIASDEERLRLRNILLDNRGSLTGGFIVRTAGAGRSEEELKADLAFLTNLWNDIRTRAERSRAPALLHRDLTLVERILRDLLSPDFKCVRVDSESEYEHVLDFVSRFQPALVGQVKLYTRDAPMFEEFGVQAEIDKALKPKVWLKSGGYIVINQTEALVAIDVNTGKYVGKTNRLEDTIVKTNIDAVIEIVRQIRLRDLGGIIVIDFIDMDERRNRAKVVQALEDALSHDRAPAKILAFNEFGLVALTRKRAKQSLERTLCEPCPYCTGAGWVKSATTVTNEILAEARKMASQIDGKVITLRVNPQVAAALKAKAGAMISELESAARKEIVIKSDPAVHQERFEIF
ncbi:MAG: Rne/Rng family ribonuclease, partial [Terriglobia bacterium]